MKFGHWVQADMQGRCVLLISKVKVGARMKDWRGQAWYVTEHASEPSHYIS
jgi:hypothetical protein